MCAQRDCFLLVAGTVVFELAECATVHPGDDVLEACWVFVFELDGVAFGFDEVAIEGATKIAGIVT